MVLGYASGGVSGQTTHSAAGYGLPGLKRR